jgi:DNA-binding transcriptional ArsR family regulator
MMDIFEVVADPTRRQILELLRDDARLVGELVELLNITQPNVSKHLRVLRDAGLVTVHRDAQWRRYELNPEPLAEVEAWLQPYRELMEARYDRLDALLNKLQADKEEEDGQT